MIEVEDVGLQLPRPATECRADAEARRRAVPLVADRDPRRVDAVVRQKLVGRRRDVDRRKSEGPAALLPLHDRPAHAVRSAEEGLGGDEVAFTQRLADPGGTHDGAAERDRLDDRDREAVRLPNGPERPASAPAPVTEL